MRSQIDELIHLIEARHPHERASPDAPARIDAFEHGSGFMLPPDMRAFYCRLENAVLFERYQILPVDSFMRTGAALLGEEWADSEPPSWYAFCDVFDGNYIGIDLAPSRDGTYRILDCDHEDTSDRRVIGASFTEFLTRAIKKSRSLYYLGGRFRCRETLEVPYNPPLAFLRRENHEWSLFPEVGPETCPILDCTRSRVKFSVYCRRHHFESHFHLPYPFDE